MKVSVKIVKFFDILMYTQQKKAVRPGVPQQLEKTIHLGDEERAVSLLQHLQEQRQLQLQAPGEACRNNETQKEREGRSLRAAAEKCC